MTISTLAVDQLADADAVDRAIETLYGTQYLGTGVLHVTSVWRKDPDTHLSIRIGPESPTSDIDQLALQLARARADAIVTTGRILRLEPDLNHSIQGPGRLPQGLADWRTKRMGKHKPAASLVMTSGRDLPLGHPIFKGPGRVLIYTDSKGAWNVESRAADAGVEVVADDSPTPQKAIDVLRAQLGCATISIEAGPTVSRRLYEPPMKVDELLLSVYRGSNLSPKARGLRHIPPRDLERLMTRVSGPFVDADQEPHWEFHRYLKN